ncbi:MAG: hypothetical protein OXI33_07695 [Chloroflexota bacterium]|nr:hypothetical protein [Chloroflexota bacterium]
MTHERSRGDWAEVKRQFGVVDLMLSSHAILRDRYTRIGLVMSIGLIAMSLFLSVVALIDDAVFRQVGLDAAKTRILLAVPSIVILVVSITDLIVDWRSRGRRHGESAELLAQLKAKYRSKPWTEVYDQSIEMGLTDMYNRTMERLIPIPDRQFNRLKARHRFKQFLSQATDENPRAPVWFLRVVLRVKGAWAALRWKMEEKNDAK